MRKIELTQITRPGEISDLYLDKKKYSIYLGNRKFIYIGSLKQAQIELNRINRFLNFQLIELNEIYIDVFSWYRQVWCYLDPDSGSDYRMKAAQASDLIHDINRSFEKIDKNHGTSASTFAWSRLNSIAHALVDLIDVILWVYEKRSEYYQIRVLETISARINNVIERLTHFPDKIKPNLNSYEIGIVKVVE